MDCGFLRKSPKRTEDHDERKRRRPQNAYYGLLAGLDGGFVGEFLGWVVNKVLEAVMDLESKALAIVLRVEYLVRAVRVSMQNAWKAYNLTNKCSKCRCIGHNKQNHDDALEKFLMAHNLYSAVNDAGDLVGAAEEDGWMDG